MKMVWATETAWTTDWKTANGRKKINKNEAGTPYKTYTADTGEALC